MSQLFVKPITSRREQKQFINLPWKLYEGDPNWVPPLLVEHRKLLNYRHHPFYDDAEIQTFLALRDGEVCGRVAALVNHAHNRRMNEKRGFFGFFESVDDQEVANALFSAARNWLRERGMQAIRGPCNPSLNYELGLLIDGFDKPPTFMMTYNKPYYGRLIEGAGFKKVTDMYAFWGHMEMLAQIDKKLFFIVNESKSRFNVTVRAMDRSRFRQEVEMFLRVYNESLVGTWGFAPLSAGEIDVLSRTTTWTMSRDTQLGISFVGTMFYDGQGFMVRKADGITSAKDLSGAAICIESGTTTELNAADYFAANGMEYNAVVFVDQDEVVKAEGKPIAVSALLSRTLEPFDLARFDISCERSPAVDPEAAATLSKEPLGPLSPQSDPQFADIVRWTVYGLIQAEEYGITSANVQDFVTSEVPEIARFLGQGENASGSLYGIANDFMVTVITQVGNYGEIFERNLGAETPFGLGRGPNALWTDGGLMYSPPFR